MKKRHTLQVIIATLTAAVSLTGCTTGGTHRMTVERIGATPGYYGELYLKGERKPVSDGRSSAPQGASMNVPS